MILRERVHIQFIQIFRDAPRFFDRFRQDFDELLLDVFDCLGFQSEFFQAEANHFRDLFCRNIGSPGQGEFDFSERIEEDLLFPDFEGQRRRK